MGIPCIYCVIHKVKNTDHQVRESMSTHTFNIIGAIVDCLVCLSLETTGLQLNFRLLWRDRRASAYHSSHSLGQSRVHIWCSSISEWFGPLHTPCYFAVMSSCMLVLFFTWLIPTNTRRYCFMYDCLPKTFADCPSSLISLCTHNTWRIVLSQCVHVFFFGIFCCYFPKRPWAPGSEELNVKNINGWRLYHAYKPQLHGCW